MKRIVLPLLALSLLFSPAVHAQTVPAYPKTFLWRISGKGLANNSFLYGTMHLQDKRLFYFGDSLYHYLEKAEGYAMEVDMQELMDSIVQKMVDQKMEERINKIAMGKDKKKTIDSLVKNVRLYNDKSSKRQLETLRQEKLRKAMRNKEMPTIMDAYLYSIARRQGKWLGGIEDVQDQLSVVDELGKDITSGELLATDKELVTTLEEMIRIYLSQDLEKLQQYSMSGYSEDFQDMLLFKRNKKMAMRMDSLAHVRSMFFAVGAAHLPGDSGVISLLKRRGYTVEPVFSSSRIDPVSYASKLSEVPWIKVSGDNNAYQVEMPGKAADLSMFNDAFKMKYYVDIGTLTYFMSGSVFASKGVDADKMMENISQYQEGEVLSKKKITTREASGMECIVLSNGYYFKVQYLIQGSRLYMLMSGGDKRENLERADVNKFFQSLVINKDLPTVPPAEWSSFGIEGKAFTIELPGVPKENKAIEKKADGTEWKFAAYDYVDPRNGIYYMVQVKDTRPGFYIVGDTSYFSLCRATMQKAMGKMTINQYSTVDSFPAFHLEGESADGSAFFKTLFINRGSRVYVLIAGGPIDLVKEGSMDRFIHSFTFTPYVTTEWARETVPGGNFSVLSPSKMSVNGGEQHIEKPDDSGIPGKTRFVSFDTNESMSYNIIKSETSPYYWVENDSMFYEAMLPDYRQTGDSVISKRAVSNGGLKGIQWTIQLPDNNNRKVIRQLRNGDTLLTLVALIPLQYVHDGKYSRFFDEFMVTKEARHSSLFANKTAKLLADLQSSDTLLFRKAAYGLTAAPFSRQDLALLHEALLPNYMDDSLAYTGARAWIKRIIGQLADSSTIRFIQSRFNDFPGDKEDRKFDMLEILAGVPTEFSYAALKDILLHHAPVTGGGNKLSYKIMDSLELTRKLFPEILSLGTNQLFTGNILMAGNRLLDSNLVTLELLRPYERDFLHMADTLLFSLRKKKVEDEYYAYQYFELLTLLGHYNDTASNRRLQQFLLLNNQVLKRQTAVILLQNKQAVAPAAIERLASDMKYRRGIYDDLVKFKSEKLFPARYLTQVLMSESDIYEYGGEDNEGDMQVSFVGTRTRSYHGEQKKFYLYKIKFSYESGEEKPDEYLGVAGPYDMDAKHMATDNSATGVYYKEPYEAKRWNELVDAYFRMLSDPGNDE